MRQMALAAAALAALSAPALAAEPLRLPVLVPVTGFLALEGTSQRNGAVLAVEDAPQGLEAEAEVTDTGTSPEGAVLALERALAGEPIAVAASMLGTQMLAMMPIAEEQGVPLLTVSGTAAVTEAGNPWVFRFFPTDAVVKKAQARYIVEEMGARRAAIVYQTTAYGQSGREHLVRNLEALGAEVVFDEGVAPTVKDMLPVLSKALAAQPEVLVLHLHSAPTALFVKQAAASGVRVPIVAGSAMHQPATAALLEPRELAGVCAETGSSPLSAASPGMGRFAERYRERFGSEPDAFAVGQYDGVTMALSAVAAGADTPEKLREALSAGSHEGLAMTYRSDGAGNMAHDAVIICYDGESRVPQVVKRYENVSGQP